MDILDIHAEIKNFRANGVTFNLDERIHLENALMKLQSNQKVEELHLWGKITGIAADYYIAVGYTYTGMYEFPVKKFFWALSKGDLEFSEMPELNDQHKAAVNYATQYFEGNPKKVLIKVKKEGEEGAEGGAEKAEDAGEGDGEGAAKAKADNLSDLSEEEEIKIPPKDLTELDRLTFVVFAIENDCAIAPLGAFKMTPTHQVRRNEAFRGLSNEQQALQNFLHFRNVQSPAYKEQLDQPGAPFNANFLESIADDQPRGLWTLQGGSDSDEKIVTIRSIMWPGFMFYHKAGTKKFGNLYIGDGLKNEELHFMI